MKIRKGLYLAASGLSRFIDEPQSASGISWCLATKLACHRAFQIKLARLGLVLFFLLGSARAQTDPNAGIPRFSTQIGGQYDRANPATSNIFVSIPVRSKTGKVPFALNLVSNFHMWVANGGTAGSFWKSTPGDEIG